MKKNLRNRNRAEIAGMLFLLAAIAAYFIHPLFTIVLLLFYIVLCVVACFFPQINFLGQVVSRGRSGKNYVAVTFDDGPSEPITRQILDLLDTYHIQATFFVTGVAALRHPDIISDMVARGHSIGNHSYSHNPFVMTKPYQTLYREVYEAQSVLRKMGIQALAFRPPVGIINPKLPSILEALGLFCVTFNCRALDAGNRRVKNLAARISKNIKADAIILLHDMSARPIEDNGILLQEIEKILMEIMNKGMRIVPLAELIGRDVMICAPRQ
ncbi:MAG: polysaccharide deacetylase [Syntrophaceae bacterium]|nr:MAG: polysaccharide deacetylase [Syntrophaceae bacterium]